MKKGKFVFGLASITLVAVLLSGCLSLINAINERPRNVTFDPDIPKERTALVRFDSDISVVTFNGVNIREAWYGGDDLWYNVNAVIPAGETRLLFNMLAYFHRGNTTYTFKRNNLELNYNFEARGEYTVGLQTVPDLENPRRRKVFLSIWEGVFNPRESYNSNILRTWELGGY